MSRAEDESREAPEGDTPADQLIADCMVELRRIARGKMRGQRGDHTLQTTALINEAYLKLRHQDRWESREHFIAVAVRAMRQILIDHARTRGRAKRPDPKQRIPLEFADAMFARLEAAEVDAIALEDALQRLEATGDHGAEAVRVIALRLYGDLTLPDVADLLQTPLRTIERRWQYARAWLHDALRA